MHIDPRDPEGGCAKHKRCRAPPGVRHDADGRDYPRQPDPSHDRHEHGHHDSHHGGYYKKKKREGFLSDLFDFD